MKALYQFLGGEARGHYVEKLMAGLDDSLEISHELLYHAKRLDHLYFISRYPDGLTYGTPHEHFTREDAKAAINSAGTILRFSQNILDSPIIISANYQVKQKLITYRVL